MAKFGDKGKLNAYPFIGSNPLSEEVVHEELKASLTK